MHQDPDRRKRRIGNLKIKPKNSGYTIEIEIRRGVM